ncbi:basic amino acid ABC transporter substrate-binding protein [Peribacillus simplex]|uniref:Amino acid ABC transporter substrate-binding protein, PAAT family n=1 Tax=Peribacillus simplex TaxID=1478 RepID=A0A9X8WMJ1_9BACI|nr:basic amino acid ABC transporter substrate-binding protein [Peribacillus simplex]WHY57397.1 basic amino acid ABC transporter substrate-binding protein [Peribacillus simplex]SIR94693.1 amino acid ABC transporter substrate-binding protein, PAAT family [Peribacillus simplex]
MKKVSFLVFAMVASLLLVLTGCGKGKEVSTTGKEEESNGKTLRIVTDANYAPFEYLEGDKIVGFDVDFINAVAKEAGYEVKLESVGWDPIFVEIEGKRADVAISAITVNDERKQSYDFSVPYFLSTNKILVPENSDIKSGDELKGNVIAVQTGTTGQEATEKLLGKNHKDIKKFENNNLAIQELLKGGASAVVADNTVVEEYVKNNPDQKLKVVEDSKSFNEEFYGLMFPKGSELKSEFDKAVNAIYENGKYAEIYKKWFGTDPDIETLKAQQ